MVLHVLYDEEAASQKISVAAGNVVPYTAAVDYTFVG